MNYLFRMRELIEQITEADAAYFGKDTPIMTDREYDALVDELAKLERQTGVHFKNSPIGRVGGEVKQGLTPVKHSKPMLSCDKTKEIKDLAKFIERGDVVLSWKMDGLTLVLRYEKGEFRQAITRGRDGIMGEDVTHTVREMRNIPMHVPCKEPFEVRGEGVLSFEDYHFLCKLGENGSHPRNVASGAVRSYAADKGKLFHMDFFAFELIKDEAPDKKLDQLEWLKDNGFDVVAHQFIKIGAKTALVQAIEEWTPDGFAYPVDGLVAEYDDLAFGRSLGATAHHEKRMLALKWKDELKMTMFRGVKLNTTRSGKVSIVCLFDDVMFGDTIVSRAYLHNLSNFEQLELGIGDVLHVYKANMVVPQVAENLTRSGTFVLPKYCPGCGEELVVRESAGGVRDLYCPNEGCASRSAGKIARFCDRDAMDIDALTATTIEKLVSRGWIRNFKDLYHLDIYADEILSSHVMAPDVYERVKEQIKNSRRCLMNRFLVGMGIPLLGKEAARALHDYYYGSMAAFEDDIRARKRFNHIEGISESLSDSIYEWYDKPFNRNMLHAMMAELTFLGTQKVDAENPFAEKQIVVTGTFESFDHPTLMALLESLGAIIRSDVAEDVDYVLYGQLPNGEKIGSAVEYGVTLIGEQVFAEMLKQNR